MYRRKDCVEQFVEYIEDKVKRALFKTATEYCEHEKRREECELCPDEFRLELLTNLDMMLMVAKAFGVGLPRQLKVMPGLIISK